MSDRVGQQVGNYLLTKLLGRGGFAEVYLAEHVLLNTSVAIKLLQTQLLASGKEQFLEEARTIARLKHPHIVRLLYFDSDPDTGGSYLVMDYAPNGNLRQLHPKGTKLPLATVLHYISQVAPALQYAHNNKVMHLDVKPENMLLDEQNAVLLSDFGLSTVVHSSMSMKTQAEAGTIYYMPPEQIRGKPRPASDQYALAITVYHWLCGVHPFVGNTTIDIAMQHVNDAPAPLRNHVPVLSTEVEQVVLKALAKDPQQHYESVATFAQALEQAGRVVLPQVQSPAIITPSSQSLVVTPPQSKLPVAAPVPLAPLPIVQPIQQLVPVVKTNSKVTARNVIIAISVLVLVALLGTATTLDALYAHGQFYAASGPKAVSSSPSIAPSNTRVASGTTTTTASNELPVPSSFQKSVGATTIGLALKYPTNWTEEAPQTTTTSDYVRWYPLQTQYGILFVIQRFSASTSTSFSSADDLNQQLLQSFSSTQGVHNLQKLPTVNPQRTIGGTTWTEQDADYLNDNGISRRFTSISVQHNKLYDNIVLISPGTYYDEAMQKYLQPMLDSLQFLS